MKYEIAITGSSRPDLYQIFWESFNKMTMIKGNPKITAYEDVIFPEESLKVRKFIEKKVDNYIEMNSNKRLGYVFDKLLKNLECEYFVYLQDDWRFLKESYAKPGTLNPLIDFDLLIDIMDKNTKIQQIIFPKHFDGSTYRNHCGKTIEINGISLTEFKSWAFLPNIARTSFVKNIWSEGELWREVRPESPFKKILKKKKMNNVSYLLGGQYKEKWTCIDHLGIGDQTTKKMMGRR